MYGADVAQLRQLARAFDEAAAQLDQERMSVGNAIRLQAWAGPVAVRFRVAGDSDHSLKVAQAATRLSGAASALRRNADEQEGASAVTGATDSPRSLSRWESDHAVSRDAPSGARGFVQELAGMKDEEDGVRIQKIVGHDGVTRYVVYINGSGTTGDGPWGGDLGWDNNPGAAASLDSRTLDHIRAKIASVVDPDAEVALIGFSQGGMIAQRLADEGSFHCTTVMTYGSPVLQDSRNFGGADVIRLEHHADIVPRLSFVNPVHDPVVALMDQVTGNVAPSAGEDVTFRAGGPKWGSAHTHGDYGWVAEEFDRSRDERFASAKDSLDRFAGRIVADER